MRKNGHKLSFMIQAILSIMTSFEARGIPEMPETVNKLETLLNYVSLP